MIFRNQVAPYRQGFDVDHSLSLALVEAASARGYAIHDHNAIARMYCERFYLTPATE
jgi:hypothetical protein